MENATKALLMGAGMLIAVLTIGIVVMVMNSASQNYKTEFDVETLKQITAFNKEYESYNKKLLRGTEIISLCNKAISNNVHYEGVAERNITIEFKMEEAVVYKSDNDGTAKGTSKSFKTNSVYTMNDISSIKGDSEAFNDFKRRIFNCTSIEYNNISGYVSKMTFKEQKIDYSEGL